MYLDVDLIYALIKEKDFHKELASKIIELNEEKITSTLAMLELEIVTKRELGNEASLKVIELAKNQIPNLKIVEFSKKHFEKSLELREKYGLGIFDAGHAAICLEKNLEIASTDQIFKRIPGLKIKKA